MAEMRQFESGATRDSNIDKLDFEGFDSPLVNKRYAQYMHLHRKQADGSMRGSSNWQAGIPKAAYIESLIRHVEDVKLHWDGYADESVDADFESVLCAVLFNCKGLLFELLKERREKNLDKGAGKSEEHYSCGVGEKAALGGTKPRSGEKEPSFT